MDIKVLFLGEVARHAHTQVDFLSVEDGALLSDVFAIILDLYPDIRPIAKFLFISINGKLVPRSQPVLQGDDVAFFFRSGGG